MRVLQRKIWMLLWLGMLSGLVGCLPSYATSFNAVDKQRLATFAEFWEALDERYPYFGRLDLDWDELRNRYRPMVTSAKNPAEFYHLLSGILSELDDPHVSLEVPRDNWTEAGVSSTSITDPGSGFQLLTIGRKGYGMSWPKGEEPLVPEGLKGAMQKFPQLVGIEGYPYATGMARILLRGAPGSLVELELRWPDDRLSRHVLRRPPTPDPSDQPTSENGAKQTKADVSSVGIAAKWLEKAVTFDVRESLVPDKRIGVLKLTMFRYPGFSLVDYLSRLDEFVDEARELDGLGIDLGKNGGGFVGLGKNVVVRFLQEPALLAYDPEDHQSWFNLGFPVLLYLTERLSPREPLFAPPIVVLVSYNTGSMAEHVARMLQQHAGALVVGTQTLGIESMIEEVVGQDGSVLRFGSKGLRSVRGQSFQDRGVIADLPIEVSIDEIRELGLERANENFAETIRQQAGRAFERLFEQRGG